jgi:hypothetical protein
LCLTSRYFPTSGIQAQHWGIFDLSIAVAVMGTKNVRIANIPHEVPDESLRATLALFVKVMAIQEEM